MARELTVDEFLPGQCLAIGVLARKALAEQALIERAVLGEPGFGALFGEIAEEIGRIGCRCALRESGCVPDGQQQEQKRQARLHGADDS